MAEHKSVALMHPDLATPPNTAIDALSQKHHTTFIALYHEHLPRVYRYALSCTGSIPDAQDITSQTFLTGFEQFKRYQGRSQISTWLLGIAHHKVIDYLRKQKRFVSLDEHTIAPSSTLNVESAVEQGLNIERVIRAMAVLSVDRREALSLHLFGQLSIQETADVMQRTYAAAQLLIQRGLADLRIRLQEDK